MTPEQRAYQRGYRAGRKKGQEEARHDTDRLLTAIVTAGLLADASEWKMGDKKVRDSDAYAELAKRFVRKL